MALIVESEAWKPLHLVAVHPQKWLLIVNVNCCNGLISEVPAFDSFICTDMSKECEGFHKIEGEYGTGLISDRRFIAQNYRLSGIVEPKTAEGRRTASGKALR